MSQANLTSLRLPPEVIVRLQAWVSLHRVFWVLTLICFFIAWNRGLALLYGLFALLAAVLLLSYVLPLLQFRGVSVERLAAGELFVGREGRIDYRIRTPASRYHLELQDTLPFVGEKSLSLFIAKVTGQADFSQSFECILRGCYRVNSINLLSAYPFGIFPYTRQVITSEEEFMVFPQVVELQRLPMPISAANSSLGDTPITQEGGHDEFAAVRDYYPGDALNRIHWAASARYGNLVVKEYERLDHPALLIVLDCRPGFNLGEGNRSSLEVAISLAASMARFATLHGMQCFLVAEDVQQVEAVLQPYTTNLYTFYEKLARIRGEGHCAYHSLVEQAQRQYPQANLVTSFRLDSSLEAVAMPANVTHIDIEMHSQSFLYPAQVQRYQECRRSGNCLTYPVTATTELKSLFP